MDKSFIKKLLLKFQVNNLYFILLFLILLLWQMLIILHSPYSKDALEVFVGLSIVGYINEKFVRTIYFYVILIVIFLTFIILSVLNLPHSQWIILMILLLGRKIKIEKNGG